MLMLMLESQRNQARTQHLYQGGPAKDRAKEFCSRNPEPKSLFPLLAGVVETYIGASLKVNNSKITNLYAKRCSQFSVS